MKKICIALLLALSLLFSLCGCAGQGSDVPAPSGADVSDSAPAQNGPLIVGSEAPDFTATLTTGESFTLSDHKDEVVLLNFWATWCPPCVRELPVFETLAGEKIPGFTLLAVNCSEWKDTVDAFLADAGYTFHVAYDENGAVGALYPTDGIPYTLVINRGVISKIFLGVPDAPYETYKAAVEACLQP